MGGLGVLDQLELGDHVCWTVDDDAVRLDAVVDVLASGLRSRQKVCYLGPSPATILDGLVKRDVATRSALATGQLVAETPEGSYLAGGSFDAAATVEHFLAEKEKARDEGYRGLRVVGDMSWASRGVPGSESLEWYEARINEVFVDGFVAGVCAYDRRLFDPLTLRRLALAHPGAAGPLLPFDPASSLRCRRTTEPFGIRLSGEADMSNRCALESVLAGLIADLPSHGGEAIVDVTGLRFADTAAARVVIRAVADSDRRIRVRGCLPVVGRLLRFHGLTNEAIL
ncbi:MEDS domain-containing protein [Paractinoplanes atraurantiacus]|uniref:STAS domain-containing protein n=1 Tax=Paractinoplanes atraurantiacus TaxID=1036182 RepID=A0A285J0B8_9ACTN|nr:MEDS domain-containing protein [Actinoplanes atraurantiacus]SNY52786.1 STAS domain-containing protein [Actinoplanes atraurantiacus]